MLILVGKSCSGKDTIQKELIKRGMKSVISYTTRPPRGDEVEGVEYHFISEEEFLEKKSQGFFAECVSYNVSGDRTWYYGSAVEDLADDKVFIANPYGLRQIKQIESLNSIAFYIMANDDIIWSRLRQRGDNEIEAKRRLEADKEDFRDIDKEVDFAFKNDSSLSPELLADMILSVYNKVINVR